jgi:hypothetical protein
MAYKPHSLNELPVLNTLETLKTPGMIIDEEKKDESWSLFLYLLNKDRNHSKIGIFCLVETSKDRKKLLDLAGVILVEKIAPVVRIQKHRVWKWLDVQTKGDDEEHIDLTLDFFTQEEIKQYQDQNLTSTINLLKEIRLKESQKEEKLTTLTAPKVTQEESYPEKPIHEKPKTVVDVYTAMWLKALAIKSRQDDIETELIALNEEKKTREKELEKQLIKINAMEKKEREKENGVDIVKLWIPQMEANLKKRKKKNKDAKNASVDDLIPDIKELINVKSQLTDIEYVMVEDIKDDEHTHSSNCQH